MRVLVAEDEKGVADFLRQGLREAGYAVDVARDGTEALDLMRRRGHDLVILDVLMPGIDGVTALRKARSRGMRAPVILLTARDEVRDKVNGLDSGADDYITKPFAFPELLARIRALLRRPPVPAGTVLRAQGIHMDVARHEVTVDGCAVELSPREYALLELFMRHPDQVLTRAQIAQAVWESSFCTGTNVVDVYVGYLRRKLGRTRTGSLVQTVRGMGYRLRGRSP
jgi:DNA-binding response OmpR family regulator